MVWESLWVSGVTPDELAVVSLWQGLCVGSVCWPWLSEVCAGLCPSLRLSPPSWEHGWRVRSQVSHSALGRAVLCLLIGTFPGVGPRLLAGSVVLEERASGPWSRETGIHQLVPPLVDTQHFEVSPPAPSPFCVLMTYRGRAGNRPPVGLLASQRAWGQLYRHSGMQTSPARDKYKTRQDPHMYSPWSSERGRLPL